MGAPLKKIAAAPKGLTAQKGKNKGGGGTSKGSANPPLTKKNKGSSVGVGKPKIRPPSTAAVSVTCADQGSYAEVIRAARGQIDLKSFGIEDQRPRRAITGALIFEICGESNGPKADALARGSARS